MDQSAKHTSNPVSSSLRAFGVFLFPFLLSSCITKTNTSPLPDGSVYVGNNGGNASVQKITVAGHDYIVLVGYQKAAICPAKEDSNHGVLP